MNTTTTGRSANKRVIALSTGGKILRFHKERVVVGSVVSADIRLTGDGISPIHAVIELGGDGATIYDLASDSGVFVNGQKSVTRKLNSGDDITIGRFNLKFSVEDVDRMTPDARTRESGGGRKLFVSASEDIGALLLEDERQVEDIFDYRQTNIQALQVVMSWRGTILDVEHFVRRREITLGQTRSADFGIPPLLGSKQFAIVSQAAQGYVLNLDPQMKGVLQRRGELKSLEEIRTMMSGQGNAVPIDQNDFAKVTIGEIDFYLSFTPAPPRLKRNRWFDRDPLLFKVILGSLLLTIMTVIALLQLPVNQQLEAEEVPERIATILYQPEKYQIPPVAIPKTKPVAQPTEKTPPPKDTKVPPPKPVPQPTVKVEITPHNKVQPVPKEMNVATNDNKKNATKSQTKGQTKAQNEAREGEGARAHGKEGTRGAKNAAKNNQHQDQAFRPSPNGGKGRGSGNSQIKDEGNVDILKGASDKIQNLLGNSSAQLGKDGEKLKGFGGFNTQGEGGLALSGSGAGGGGNAASLGGLGNKGRGGGKVGTGLGAAGSGNGIIGGAARTVLRTGGPEETVVMGAIDASAIEAAIMAQRERFRLCYEKEINAESPAKGGSVTTNFVIASSGRVTEAGIEKSTLGIPPTEGCILGVLKSIQFPIPRGAGVVQVSFPFKFNPIGK